MKVYAIVVATDKRGYYEALVQSCRRNNIELIVLGQGQKWGGFAWRFTLVHDRLKMMDDRDVVIFLDAYDIIATQNISVIKTRFQEFGSPIVISVEQKNNKDNLSRYVRSGVFGTCSKANVCGGAYMGYVYALKKLYSYICKEFHCDDPGFDRLDDQRILTHVCNDDEFVGKYIRYDHDSYIFFTIPIPNSAFDRMANHTFHPDQKIYNVKDNRLYLKKTDTSPCFIHGNANANMDYLMDLYQLPKRRDMRRTYFFTTFMHQSKFFKLELFVIFVMIVIFVGSLVYVFRSKNKKKNTL